MPRQAVQRRLVEVEEDIGSLYNQFSVLNEFLIHKFGKEFHEFSKRYFDNADHHTESADDSEHEEVLSCCNQEEEVEAIAESSETCQIHLKNNDDEKKVEDHISGEEILLSNVHSINILEEEDPLKIYSEMPTLQREDFESTIDWERIVIGEKTVSTPDQDNLSSHDSVNPNQKQFSRRKASMSHRLYDKTDVHNEGELHVPQTTTTKKKKSKDSILKNHKCPYCLKKFRMRSHLVDHQRIHTGEKPFVCFTCSRAFRQASALRVHTRSHTNEKPYECTVCCKRFRQSISLRSHLKTHM